MAFVLRALLWAVVVIAPGGVLLLPFLAADAMRQRKALPAAGLGNPSLESPRGTA